MRELVSKLLEIAAPVADSFGLSIWDADFAKEGSAYFLTLYIDREGGVSIDDCENMSRALDPLVDSLAAPTLPSYIFSVSSAGLGRRLSKPAHFEKSLGKEVELTFYRPIGGRKAMTGTLAAFGGGTLTLCAEDGGQAVFSMSDIASARLHFKF